MPRWTKLIVGVILVCALSLGIVLWAVVMERQRACDRVVEGRDDNRAMWEYLIDVRNEPDNPEVVAFVEHMDSRIPRLHCVGFFGTRPEPVA